MRRPGGAVRPAMKPAIGFLRPRLASSIRNCAACSSASPPISPIMMMLFVASSARNSSRSEEHTSELQSLMSISYAVFCLKKKKNTHNKEYNMSQQQNKSTHYHHTYNQ